jgi:hypothetical protein
MSGRSGRSETAEHTETENKQQETSRKEASKKNARSKQESGTATKCNGWNEVDVSSAFFVLGGDKRGGG